MVAEMTGARALALAEDIPIFSECGTPAATPDYQVLHDGDEVSWAG